MPSLTGWSSAWVWAADSRRGSSRAIGTHSFGGDDGATATPAEAVAPAVRVHRGLGCALGGAPAADAAMDDLGVIGLWEEVVTD